MGILRGYYLESSDPRTDLYDSLPISLNGLLNCISFTAEEITGIKNGRMLAHGVIVNPDLTRAGDLVMVNSQTRMITPAGKAEPLSRETKIASLQMAVMPQPMVDNTFTVRLTRDNWKRELIDRLPDQTLPYAISLSGISLAGRLAAYNADTEARGLRPMPDMKFGGFYFPPHAGNRSTANDASPSSSPSSGLSFSDLRNIRLYGFNRFIGGMAQQLEAETATATIQPLDETIDVSPTGRKSPAPRAYVYI